MLVRSQVKYIQSLGQKKFRDQEGVFVAEGPKLVGELLKATNIRTLQVFATKEWMQGWADALKDARKPAPLTVTVEPSALERISTQTTPNQVLAVFAKPVFDAPLFASSVSLMLDGIQDPGNLGAIIRTADWFGVRQIVCSLDASDVFNPKTVQSTMGSICRVQVLYRDLLDFLQQQAGVPVYAAALEGQSIYEAGRIDSGIIVIGNESKGIREPLMEKIPGRLTIPGRGAAESLNAAVATGILLSHLLSPGAGAGSEGQRN